jgi:LPS sulfotransferase NodH
VGRKVETYFESLRRGGARAPGSAVGAESSDPVVRDLVDLGELLEAMFRFHRFSSPQADHEGFRRRLDACSEALSACGEEATVGRFLAHIDPPRVYQFLAQCSDEQLERALRRALSGTSRTGGLEGFPGTSSPVSLTYAVCGTPRCGSSLLCKTLAATGLAGDPQEYFWNWKQSVAAGYSHDAWVHWTETSWAREGSFTDWGRFSEELMTRKASANGVFGAQIMGTYFDELLGHLQKLGGSPDESDADLLGRWLPHCRYVRLVRRDKIRQAVSWAIADQTGVYNSTWPHPPKRKPEFDPWMVDDRYRRILGSEARWDRFFTGHRLEPLTLVYEDFTGDFEGAILAILAHLEIELPEGFSLSPPRLIKQATNVNEEWVDAFLAWTAAGNPVG